MYYHVKLANVKKEIITFDRNENSVKKLKEQLYSKTDIICEGHIIRDNEKKNCYIINTPYTAEVEVEVLNNKYPDVLVITKASLFNEYKNIIDEL